MPHVGLGYVPGPASRAFFQFGTLELSSLLQLVELVTNALATTVPEGTMSPLLGIVNGAVGVMVIPVVPTRVAIVPFTGAEVVATPEASTVW